MIIATRKNRPRTGKRSPRTQMRNLIRKKRHIKVLQAIERYGLSDTPHLGIITKLEYKNLLAVASDLYDWGMIDRPNNKSYNRDELNDPLVYQKNDDGTDWLEANGLLPKRALWFAKGGTESHNLKVALALATFEYAFTTLGFTFIPWEELLEGAPEHIRNRESPWRFDVDGQELVPDGIFSVATPDDYRCVFFLEVDLSDHSKKNYRIRTEQYRNLIFRGIYKDHLNVTQRAAVATITCIPRNERAMASFCQKNDPFYFKLIPEYHKAEKFPPPSVQLLAGWHWKSEPEPVNLQEVL
jgi:hypothetical protein